MGIAHSLGFLLVIRIFNSSMQHIESRFDEAFLDFRDFLKRQWAFVELTILKPVLKNPLQQFLDTVLSDFRQTSSGSLDGIGKENNCAFLEARLGTIVSIGGFVGTLVFALPIRKGLLPAPFLAS